MVEYVIILPSLLLIILGAIQLALIYQAKSTLNYATFLAARQGALHHGQNCVGAACIGGGMEVGLAYGLMPLYQRSSAPGKAQAALALVDAGVAVQQANPLKQATISTLNPTSAWVAAAKAADQYTPDVSAVPNDNLMYRSTATAGSGAGAMNLQDGNLLKIEVTYCFKLEVPFANQVIYAVNNLLTPAAPTGHDSLPTAWSPPGTTIVPTGTCAALNLIPDNEPFGGKYLAMAATAIVRMQSPYIGP